MSRRISCRAGRERALGDRASVGAGCHETADHLRPTALARLGPCSAETSGRIEPISGAEASLHQYRSELCGSVKF